MSAGIPTGELTIAATNHADFQTNGNAALQPRILYPTLAWLDRWLLDDAAALDRIAAPLWEGTPRNEVLSSYYTSALSTPEHTCADLRTC